MIRVDRKIMRILLFICFISVSYLAFTTSDIEPLKHTWDKLNHATAFFALFLLLSYSFSKLTNLYKIFMLLVYAIVIEIIQHYIPGRESSLLDILADMVGISAGYIFVKSKLFSLLAIR